MPEVQCSDCCFGRERRAAFLRAATVLFAAASLWPWPQGFAQELWVARYRGECRAEDRPLAIEVDAAGNAYVTGFENGESGERAGRDIVTIKYDPRGNQQWLASFDGLGGGGDCGHDMAFDGEGSVIVVGSSVGVGTNRDWVTIKYDSDGVEQWVARHDGPRSANDEATAVEVDDEGGIVVVGRTQGLDFRSHVDVLKYGPDGNVLWLARHDNPTPRALDPDVALGADGAVHVGARQYVVKYDCDGAPVWTVDLSGSFDCAGIFVDEADNVYVAGEVGNPLPIYVAGKYDRDGNEIWKSFFRGDPLNFAKAMAVDRFGSVFLTGRSNGRTALVKFDSSGEAVWNRQRTGYATSLAVDDRGGVYVTGQSGNDFFTELYTASGRAAWTARYAAPEGGEDWVIDVAVGPRRRVFVTGQTGAKWQEDFATIAYLPGSIGPFIRGDCNADAACDVSDAICILGWLFLGDRRPPCLAALDANASRSLNVSDAVYLLNFLFLGAPQPAAPFPECAPVLEETTLDCRTSPCRQTIE